MTLLAVKGLAIAFRQPNGGASTLVENENFTIDAGQCVALVGESGSGKSLTALSLLQLLPSSIASHPTGSIQFNSQEVIGAKRSLLRNLRGGDIGMIFQEPLSALNPLHTVEKQIGEAIWLHNPTIKRAALRTRILELLNQVEIDQPETKLKSYPHQLSGGQRQRVMIAMAIANNPKLLIADEPTTALDVTVQQHILELLQKLRRETGMAILLISHDLGIVRRLADQVLVMQYGQVVESGPASQIFENPQQTYTKLLLDAVPPGAPPAINSSAPPIVSVQNFSVKFPIKQGVLQRITGYFTAVDNVSFELKAGETLGIVGESGSGKSTLVQGLLRLIHATGSVNILGTDALQLKGKTLQQWRRQVQLVFQDPFGALSPRLPVNEIIGEGLRVHRPELNALQRDALVCTAMVEVGLDPITRHRYPHEFSGGQRQRIAIARALILQPKLIVLDEPTSALDASTQQQVLALLRELQTQHGLSYLLISHDWRVIRAMAQRTIVLQRGKLVEYGDTQTIWDNPQQAYTKMLIDAAKL